MKFLWKGKEWYINKLLAMQLISIVYNLKHDWDFVILITGDRKVRVGKSVLAMTICAYLAYTIARFKSPEHQYKKSLNDDAYNINTIFFDNKVMMEESQQLPKYSVPHYDEGREGLAASKAMKSFQQDLVDFFAECGQLNHIFVVVAPDFFELKEEIAVGRAEFLINVYRKELTKELDVFNDGVKLPITVLDRGHFEFFSRNTKARLYDIAKSTRRKNYGHVKADFIGDFTNQYPVDEAIYREKKADSLARFKERHKDEVKVHKADVIRDKIILEQDEKGLNGREIMEFLEKQYEFQLSERYIRKIIAKSKEL